MPVTTITRSDLYDYLINCGFESKRFQSDLYDYLINCGFESKRFQIDIFDDRQVIQIYLKYFWIRAKKLENNIRQNTPVGIRIVVAKWTFKEWFRYTFRGYKDLVDRTVIWGEANISVGPRIRWADLYIRRYDIIDRARDRARAAMSEAEDQAIFGLLKFKEKVSRKTEDWLVRWGRR